MLRSGSPNHSPEEEEVFSAWAILFSNASHQRLFDIYDITSLRLTCKLLNQLSSPLVRSMRLHIDELFETTDFFEATSSYETTSSEASSEEDSEDEKSTEAEDEDEEEVDAGAEVESLKAPTEIEAEYSQSMVTPPSYIKTITKLTIDGNTGKSYDCNSDLWATDGFASFLEKASSLLELELDQVHSLKFPLPATLETLKITRTMIAFRPSLARHLFTSGALPKLKTLRAENFSIGNDYEDMIMLRITMRDYDPLYVSGDADGETPTAPEQTSNWTYIMPRLNLPSLESLIFNQVQGLSVNDAYSIGQAAENLPRLREYKAPIYVESRYQSVALDLDVARTFFQSTLCARFEELDLVSMYLGGEGFGELLKNAPNMQNLKRLKLDGIYKRKIGMVAEAGANGAWPLLESFSFKIYVPFSNQRDCELNQHRMKTPSWWLDYCQKKLHPVWPGLEIDIRDVVACIVG